MPHTRQVKIHRALWINPSFLGECSPSACRVKAEVLVMFFENVLVHWWCIHLCLESDNNSAACFLDMFQNAGCVNSTQTWPFNISSCILNKSNNNEKRLTLKLNNFLFKSQSSDQKHILAWFPRAIAAREWVRWAALSLAFKSNWHEAFSRSPPHRIHHQKLCLAREILATAVNCQESAARMRSSVQRVRNWSLVIEILRALSLWHCASLRLSAESCTAAACGCNSIKDGRSYRITVSTSARLSSLWLKTSH